MRRKIFTAILSITLLFGIQSFAVISATAAVAPDDSTPNALLFENIDYQKSADIRVIIDDEQVVFDVQPQIVNGRTLVPVRAIFETLGLELEWDGTIKTVTGSGIDTTITFTIGSSIALVNGQEKILDVPADIIDNRTLIPVRFLSENMGYNVVWVQQSYLILMSKSDIVEWRYDGFEHTAPYKEYEAKYINGVKTTETRYNGKNHEVRFVTLHSADGRLIPNVPDFNIAYYGTGWFERSPFADKTYWVDIDTFTGMDEFSGFFDPSSFNLINKNTLRDSSPAGNYIKIKVESHYFSLDAWKKMGGSPLSELYTVTDERTLDGKIIQNYDTVFKVIVNDKYIALLSPESFMEMILRPDPAKVYTIFKTDPKSTFKWSDDTWNKLKGETPWSGMTKDMLLVQILSKPDITTKTTTRFSTYELWVYEYEYVDSIYFFTDGILTSMW